MAEKAKNQEQENDPSIEEILDSIRKIISDDDEPAAEEAKPQKAKAKEPEPEEEDDSDESSEFEDLDLDALMDEIGDDSDDEPLEIPEELLTEDEIDLEDSEDDVLELTEMVEEDVESDDEISTDDIAFRNVAEPEEENDEDEVDNDDIDSLLSSRAADKAAGAFAKLQGRDTGRSRREPSYGSISPRMTVSGTSLDDMVRDMLEPMLRDMLKEWLDDNLPDLVEDMVQREIEKLTRKNR